MYAAHRHNLISMIHVLNGMDTNKMYTYTNAEHTDTELNGIDKNNTYTYTNTQIQQYP